MPRILLATLLALGLCAGAARADEDAATRLAALLEPIQQLAGKFSQSRLGPGPDAELARSSGRFRLLRPAYFSWEIDSPDHQLILSDGEYLWHYDRDLDTVTRRPLAGQQAQSPLQVLAGDRAALGERYTVSETGRGRFLLVPREEHPAFAQLTLVFSGDSLGGMEVRDNLGQQLLIEFTDVDRAPGLAPADFHFEAPPGADLFVYDQ